MLKTEKQETPNRTETQNYSNGKIIEQKLTQEEKINVGIINRIMSEKKTTLQSHMNQDWKTVIEIK